MGVSNKKKKALRVRQKIANRQPSKATQIQQLIRDLDDLPTNVFTGQPIYPKPEES